VASAGAICAAMPRNAVPAAGIKPVSA
jgi:hypothetical protein